MSQYEQYSDEELIERLRKGESGISDYLMEKYKDFVKKRARAMYLIGGETDDLEPGGDDETLRRFRIIVLDREALLFHTFAGICIDRQASQCG